MRKIKYFMGVTMPILAAVCGICLTAGGVYAFFSGKAETVNNRFEIAAGSMNEDGAISIEEPLWDVTDEDGDGIPDAAQNLQPGSVVNKNPSVKSRVEYDGWVVMRVTMPKTLAALEKGQTPAKTEVFDLISLNETDFVLLDSVTDGEDFSQYYYGYKRILKAGASTEDLFGKIRVKDFAVVKEAFAGSVDIDAKITQAVDPATGTQYPSVSQAYEGMGGRF